MRISIGTRSHLDAKWSTVHIPLLTSTLPISSTGVRLLKISAVSAHANTQVDWLLGLKMLSQTFCGGIWAAILRLLLKWPIYLQVFCKIFTIACIRGPCFSFKRIFKWQFILKLHFLNIVCLPAVLYFSQVCMGFPLFKRTPLKCGTLDTD